MNDENNLQKSKKNDASISQADAQAQIRTSMGPFGPDQTIRHALTITWMLLPESERTYEKLEKTVQSLLDRALRDFKEDASSFKFNR